jgi:hypothetical protein
MLPTEISVGSIFFQARLIETQLTLARQAGPDLLRSSQMRFMHRPIATHYDELKAFERGPNGPGPSRNPEIFAGAAGSGGALLLDSRLDSLCDSVSRGYGGTVLFLTQTRLGPSGVFL